MRQTVRLFLQLQKICISHHDGVTSRLVLEEGPGIPVIKGYPEVIVETEGSVRKMQKRTLCYFTTKKLKRAPLI